MGRGVYTGTSGPVSGGRPASAPMGGGGGMGGGGRWGDRFGVGGRGTVLDAMSPLPDVGESDRILVERVKVLERRLIVG